MGSVASTRLVKSYYLKLLVGFYMCNQTSFIMQVSALASRLYVTKFGKSPIHGTFMFSKLILRAGHGFLKTFLIIQSINYGLLLLKCRFVI